VRNTSLHYTPLILAVNYSGIDPRTPSVQVPASDAVASKSAMKSEKLQDSAPTLTEDLSDPKCSQRNKIIQRLKFGIFCSILDMMY
jgi:hypothetical protein